MNTGRTEIFALVTMGFYVLGRDAVYTGRYRPVLRSNLLPISCKLNSEESTTTNRL